MRSIIGHDGEEPGKAGSVLDEEFSKRTNGGTAIFFSVLFVSTCISGYGLWTVAKYLIHEFS